jgi:hypothetical protein
MAGFGPASLPHLALVLDTVAPGGSAVAPAPLPSLGLVMYDAGIFCASAVTLGSLTSSSATNVTVSGTLAKTLATITLSSLGLGGGAGGSVGAAAPLPHLSTLFESIAGIVGQSSVTLEALTSVSEGDVPGNEIWPYEYDDKPARAPLYWPHARNVDWFQTDTVLRASTGGSFGVVGQTLQPLTVISSGMPIAGGTLAKTLDTLTGVSAGVVTVGGTLGKTLGALTSSSAAFVFGDFVGTVSKTLDTLTVSSVGTGSIACAVAKTLDNLTSVSAGTNDVSGTLAKTLQGINANIDGSVLSGFVVVVNNFLEPLTVRSAADNGVRKANEAGGNKGKSRKPDRDKGETKRVFVKIDDEEFEVGSPEEALAMLEAAKEMAAQTAKAEADKVIAERIAAAKSGASISLEPVELEMPRIMADDGAFQASLNEVIQGAYKRAEIDAEIAINLAKQRLLDEEDDVVLLLIN